MNRLWRNVRTTITEAFRNTPVEVILTIICGLLASAQIADLSPLDEKHFAVFLVTAALGLAAIFATSASHALKVFDNRTRWALTGMFAVALAVYGVGVIDVEQTTEGWRWAFLALAAVMGVMLVPVAARIGEVSASERFWRYNIRLFSRVTVAYAYGFLLYGGLAIGIAAIDGLFDLSIDGEIYGHLFVWVSCVLGTILAVGSLAEVKRIGEPFTPETLVWSGRLGSFLFMPLVLLYLGIMYVYLLKVLTTGELPSNILSPLALGAGMLGYFGLFVLQPHMHREDFKPLAALLRAFPAAFVPIVPFGVYAVWQRVAQYGWTEFRYARMAALVSLGIFSVVGAYKWLRKQEFSLVTGPAILGVMAFLGAVGPWGASYVSEASQLNRLQTALTQADLLDPQGKMVSKDEMIAKPSAEHGTTIYEATDYLLEAHGDESHAELSPIYLGEHFGRSNKLVALGITAGVQLATISVYSEQDAPYLFEHGGSVTDFSVSQYGPGTTRGVEFAIEGTALIATYGTLRGRATLEFPVTDVPFESQAVNISGDERMLALVDDDGETIGMVGIRDATLERRPESNEVVATYVSGMIVFY